MSCTGLKAPHRSGRAFCAFTALLLLLLLAVIAFGLAHVSDQPVVLGRYSPAYAVLLLGLFAVAAWLVWVLVGSGPRMERWTANFYAFLVSALVMLLLVEWALRAFNPFGVEFFDNLPYHMQGMIDDPRLGYRHPASADYMLGDNRVRINSHGLRDDEVPYTRPGDDRRILVLGDSVAFGWGVSQGESFSDRLEVLLRQRTGQGWQVINAGVNGYNTRQEADYLRVEGMRYSPDYLLLVYVSNDVEPMFDPNVTTWRRYPEWPPSLPEALNRLRQMSYLLQLTKLFSRMQQMDEARAMAEAGSDQPASRDVRSITGHPRWPESRTALLDIARQCRDAGIPLLVGLYSSLDGGHDPAFIADLRSAGIDAIHLQPAWAGVPEQLAHVSRIDSHPSALVHEKLAEYLIDIFRRRGWLGDS